MSYRSRSSRIVVVLAYGLIGLAGCGGMGGGCSNPLDVLLKVTSGRISDLTAAEILLINDFLIQSGYTTTRITEDQAAKLVEFLKLNNINTFDDVNRVATQAQTDPESIQLPPGFLELFDESFYSG